MEYKEIKKAYIAVKHVELSYQFPIYVIGLKYSFNTTEKRRKEIREELLNAGLMVWDYWLVGLSRKNKAIEYKMDQLPEARII